MENNSERRRGKRKTNAHIQTYINKYTHTYKQVCTYDEHVYECIPLLFSILVFQSPDPLFLQCIGDCWVLVEQLMRCPSFLNLSEYILWHTELVYLEYTVLPRGSESRLCLHDITDKSIDPSRRFDKQHAAIITSSVLFLPIHAPASSIIMNNKYSWHCLMSRSIVGSLGPHQYTSSSVRTRSSFGSFELTIQRWMLRII